jgi:hypothetical protein
VLLELGTNAMQVLFGDCAYEFDSGTQARRRDGLVGTLAAQCRRPDCVGQNRLARGGEA